VSLFQTDTVIWFAVEIGLLSIIAASAVLDIKLLGYEKLVLACAVLMSIALILNNMPSIAAQRVGLLCEGLVLLALGSTLGRYVAYEMQMLALPLQDVRFAAWDRSLGLDYQDMLAFLNQHDAVVKALHRAYYSFRWQILGTVAVLALFGRTRKLNIFLSALLLALIGSCIVGSLFPALGAISVLSASDLASLHWRIDGATPLDHFMKLREGHFSTLNLSELGGIISFPSFHAATALIVTHAWWRSGYVFLPVCILNVLMTMATLTHGGHYLVDTIAGLVLAALSLHIVQRRLAD
jgi:membrane-associated phospholipid phosphatase